MLVPAAQWGFISAKQAWRASKATNQKRLVGREETRASSNSKDRAALKQVASPSGSEFP